MDGFPVAVRVRVVVGVGVGVGLQLCRRASWLAGKLVGLFPGYPLNAARGQYLNVKNDLTLMVATE